MEVVMRNTNPKWVTFEVDIHWALEGLGYDQTSQLLSFLRRNSDRISMLHVKGSSPDGAAVFDRITTAGGPLDYYHFEYDLPLDPFATAKQAFEFLDCVRF